MDIKKLVVGLFLMLFVFGLTVEAVSAQSTTPTFFGSGGMLDTFVEGLFGATAPTIELINFEGSIGLLLILTFLFAGLISLGLSRLPQAQDHSGPSKAISIAGALFLIVVVGAEPFKWLVASGAGLVVVAAFVSIVLFAWTMISKSYYNIQAGSERGKAAVATAGREKEEAEKGREEAAALRSISRAEMRSLETLKTAIEEEHPIDIRRALAELDQEMAKEETIIGAIKRTLSQADRLIEGLEGISGARSTTRKAAVAPDLAKAKSMQNELKESFTAATGLFGQLKKQYVELREGIRSENSGAAMAIIKNMQNAIRRIDRQSKTMGGYSTKLSRIAGRTARHVHP
tara:strand:+ start:25 stop:1059 length:1035 start_codon:yes stop_codon:yes gene_type:complete